MIPCPATASHLPLPYAGRLADWPPLCAVISATFPVSSELLKSHQLRESRTISWSFPQRTLSWALINSCPILKICTWLFLCQHLCLLSFRRLFFPLTVLCCSGCLRWSCTLASRIVLFLNQAYGAQCLLLSHSSALTACRSFPRSCLYHTTTPAGLAKGHGLQGLQPRNLLYPVPFWPSEPRWLISPRCRPLQCLPLSFLWLGRTFKIKSST